MEAEGTLRGIMAAAEEKMKKALGTLGQELAIVRTGRATPALVEHLIVDYHGIPTPLNQLAGIFVPEARLIVIQPWDRQALPQIEKAILKGDLGLNPSTDGRVVHLPIPPLTEERRRDLIKVVKRRVEEGKVALRNVRREALEEMRAQLKDKHVSEDAHKLSQEQLQRLTESYVGQAEAQGQSKEAEILEV
ncbi:MAG: ribosome recycling factor [Chloroflexi bacterium]|nr:ribosome recycling factor [Chloroflexota bacterium]